MAEAQREDQGASGRAPRESLDLEQAHGAREADASRGLTTQRDAPPHIEGAVGPSSKSVDHPAQRTSTTDKPTSASGSAALGSQASMWATAAPTDTQRPETASTPPGRQAITAASQDAETLVGSLTGLAVSDRAQVAPTVDLAPRARARSRSPRHDEQDPPTSARESTFTLDGLTSGTSARSVAGPSTPPATAMVLPVEGAADAKAGPDPTPSTPPRAVSSLAVAAAALAAEWGMTTPSSRAVAEQTKQAQARGPAAPPPSNEADPATPSRSTRRRDSGAGSLVHALPPVVEEKERKRPVPLISRLGPPPARATGAATSTGPATATNPTPLIHRLSPAPVRTAAAAAASAASAALPPKPASRAAPGAAASGGRQPIELLPASSPSKPSSHSQSQQALKHGPPAATTTAHEPSPVVRSPRRERPRPEVRGDAFSRLSRGFLGPGGRGGPPATGGRTNGQKKDKDGI